MTTTFSPAPKPTSREKPKKAPKPRKPIPNVSAKVLAANGGKPPRKVRAPIAKVGPQKAKRIASNRAYYASPEWRAKKKAVHARDDYQCTVVVEANAPLFGVMAHIDSLRVRCPNRGEVVNGKQTARGLVAEETGYFHRGVEGSIDSIRTRCTDCDRRLTPLERVNHRYGFQSASRVSLGSARGDEGER